MKRIKYVLPDITTTTTTSNGAVEVDDTTIIVDDVSSFSQDDIILIEERGCELNEIRSISSISGSTFTLSAGLTFPHKDEITITKISYDEYKIEKSEVGVTYIEFATGNLDYSNKYNNIEVLDDTTTGSDNYYYKVYYVNSVSVTEAFQATLNKEENFSFISLTAFRAESKFSTADVTDATMAAALYSGMEWIQDAAFNTMTLTTTDQDNIFDLELEGMNIADWFGEGEVNKKAVVVYEVSNEGDYLNYSKNYLISKILQDTRRIVFKSDLPTSNRTLIMKIPVTFKPNDEIAVALRSINRLIATNYILMNVDTSKIKSGVTSWSAGGTNVNRDLNALRDSIDKNISEANRIISSVLKIYMKKTKLRSRRSSLNRNYSSGMNRGGSGGYM